MESRKIKFRQPIYCKGKFHSWYYWGFIDNTFIGPFGDPKTAEEESQQFTGLHDKNGKEIYEGDVIKHCKHCKYNYPLGYIIFYNGGFVASWKGGKHYERLC